MATSPEPDRQQGKQGWLAYIFSPQVLLGGVLAGLAATVWDYYKENRSETAKVLAEVRGSMAPHIIPTPATIAATDIAINALKRISELHENQRAKDLVNTQIAHLYWNREEKKQAEAKEREAAEKKRIEEQEARKVEEAKKALADAAASQQAAKAEELRQQEAAAAAARAVADAATRAAALERIQATLAQRALDRAPK